MDVIRQHELESGRRPKPARNATRRGTPLNETQLLDTQRAFDSVAADYDGPRGNNELIQRMRLALWDTVLNNALTMALPPNLAGIRVPLLYSRRRMTPGQQQQLIIQKPVH